MSEAIAEISQQWQLVPLDKVIRHRKEFIQIDDLSSYKRCRVQVDAKGVILRDIVKGTEIRTKKQQVCRSEDLLVAEIDAKMGGYGIVSADLDGAIVSSHYFLYEIDKTQLDLKFLDYFIRTPGFRDQVAAQGSTNYAAIRSHHVLEYQIPLPSLEEQRRVVARIEELVAKVEEARGLRSEATKEAEILFNSATKVAFEAFSDSQITVEKLVGRANLKNGKSIKANERLSEVSCVRLSAVRNGRIDCSDAKPVPMSIEEAKEYLIKPGDVFIVRGNGSSELVGQAGLVGECPENTIFPDLFIRIPLDSNQILPSFFVAWWNNPLMRDRIKNAAKTTSGIWKINQGHIASLSIPVPSLKEQDRIVTYLDNLKSKVDFLKRVQSETEVEINALLPSILDKAFNGEL